MLARHAARGEDHLARPVAADRGVLLEDVDALRARTVVDDDQRWWALLHDFYQHFKYQTIMTEDIVNYFNRATGTDLTPIFDQYLRHAAIPVLELKFDEANGTVSYRWKADEPAFAMPVRVGAKGHWQVIQPTTDWQTMKTPLKKDQFAVATDLYYVAVSKSEP